MKNFLKYMIVHILCGLLAVYLAGVVDNRFHQYDSAPRVLLFITGPLGLLVSSIAFGTYSIEHLKIPHVLDSIYNKGYNQ